MNRKLVRRNVALIIVFGVLGLTQFSENVRTVQVLGLFASGVVVGAAWTRIVAALTAKKIIKNQRNTSYIENGGQR
jgi:hypothetical protein